MSSFGGPYHPQLFGHHAHTYAPEQQVPRVALVHDREEGVDLCEGMCVMRVRRGGRPRVGGRDARRGCSFLHLNLPLPGPWGSGCRCPGRAQRGWAAATALRGCCAGCGGTPRGGGGLFLRVVTTKGGRCWAVLFGLSGSLPRLLLRRRARRGFMAGRGAHANCVGCGAWRVGQGGWVWWVWPGGGWGRGGAERMGGMPGPHFSGEERGVTTPPRGWMDGRMSAVSYRLRGVAKGDALSPLHLPLLSPLLSPRLPFCTHAGTKSRTASSPPYSFSSTWPARPYRHSPCAPTQNSLSLPHDHR